ncbi:hypothetical protein Taro_022404 [Colocasia esculenta]|uniref:Protein kinase domain-containing protein n=1 Tax=Colocasia esculenta TaxID=4460 RepID=A0A843V1A6_COLES|nr:hypothetical protein [Colocasia esculenta]
MNPPMQALVAAAASFLFVSLLFGLLVLLCGRSSKPPRHRLRVRPPPPLTSVAVVPGPEESAFFDSSLRPVSMADLSAATSNFAADRIIGDGGFGFVYLAQLPDVGAVAIKRLAPDAFHGFREFRAEVETLGRVRHQNLAQILGYCASGDDRLLIYEFLERGSLDAWLHEPAPPARDPLPWPTRVRIVCGVAAGLAFLHGDCKPSIIHRDIKASNVLLDADFEARITDFGLARRVDSPRSHISTQVAGTMGYMPPEYREGLTAATPKADVYSFGVLMFEVASGRRPNLPVPDHGKEVPLVPWARARTEAGRWADVLDALMEKEGVREEDVMGYLGMACRCTCDIVKERPSMAEVVERLKQL